MLPFSVLTRISSTIPVEFSRVTMALTFSGAGKVSFISSPGLYFSLSVLIARSVAPSEFPFAPYSHGQSTSNILPVVWPDGAVALIR